MEAGKGLSVLQGRFHQAVGLAEEIAFRKNMGMSGSMQARVGTEWLGRYTPRPVPDFTGVETGHMGVGEAGVLTAGMVRTA